jgi:hypothetical protein
MFQVFQAGWRMAACLAAYTSLTFTLSFSPALLARLRILSRSCPHAGRMDLATLDSFSQQDLTLGTTLAHLCTFLTRNLGKHYGTQTIDRLHDRIRHHLTPRLAPTWDPLNPSSGCGTRSLIAMPGRFPTPLVNAALDVGVDPVVWAKEMSESGEWQLWVDPGSICWRDGGWVWVEEGYEMERMYKREFNCNGSISPVRVTVGLVKSRISDGMRHGDTAGWQDVMIERRWTLEWQSKR